MNAIFVYGLLKPGFSLHHVVAPFVVASRPGCARGRLYDAGVPAARFDEDGDIEGFVLSLDPDRLDEALALLDDIEDEGEIYDRIIVEVATEDGTADAFAYHYRSPVGADREVGPDWR